MVQFTYPGGRFTARATTVKFLLEWAYDLLPAQHSSGPGWMSADRYYIVEHGKIVEGFANTELQANMDKLHTYLGV